VRRPRQRGIFQPVDAARRELALLSVADALGQARLYWLIDLPTLTIREARFLAFGSRASHALTDAFCELAIGRTVADACRLTCEQVDAVLRDDPTTPAVPADDLLFIPQLQALAEAAIPHLALLPKPLESAVIPAKRKEDWNEQDRQWIPLSLLKKINRVNAVVDATLKSRLGPGAPTFRIEKLNDYFRVQLKIVTLPGDQVATVTQLLQDALRSEIHPQLAIEIIST